MNAGEIPPPPEPLGSAPATTSHRGRVYALGYDERSFVISPLAGGPPIERFERTEDGWRSAWTRFQRLDRRDAVPAWRRRSAPWILLNVVIGVLAWFAVGVVDGIVLAIAGKEVEEVSDTAASGFLLAFPLAMAAWLLFAYAANRRRRWIGLLALLGAAIAVAVATGLAGQPDQVSTITL